MSTQLKGYTCTRKAQCAGMLGVVLIGAGCTGSSVDFRPKFDQIGSGGTRAQAVAIMGQPLLEETWDVAGFSFTRAEYADVKARYALVYVKTPMSSDTLLAKRQIPHTGLCK